MAFRCDFCGEPQAGGMSPVRVVTKIRHKGAGGYEWKGTEIAEEKNSCVTCHDPEFQPEVLGANPALDTVGNPVLAEVA